MHPQAHVHVLACQPVWDYSSHITFSLGRSLSRSSCMLVLLSASYKPKLSCCVHVLVHVPVSLLLDPSCSRASSLLDFCLPVVSKGRGELNFASRASCACAFAAQVSLASDAFFPFRDSLDVASSRGVK
eukprot:5287887-Pleurochrysis_carterae.AAC.1